MDKSPWPVKPKDWEIDCSYSLKSKKWSASNMGKSGRVACVDYCTTIDAQLLLDCAIAFQNEENMKNGSTENNSEGTNQHEASSSSNFPGFTRRVGPYPNETEVSKHESVKIQSKKFYIPATDVCLSIPPKKKKIGNSMISDKSVINGKKVNNKSKLTKTPQNDRKIIRRKTTKENLISVRNEDPVFDVLAQKVKECRPVEIGSPMQTLILTPKSLSEVLLSSVKSNFDQVGKNELQSSDTEAKHIITESYRSTDPSKDAVNVTVPKTKQDFLTGGNYKPVNCRGTVHVVGRKCSTIESACTGLDSNKERGSPNLLLPISSNMSRGTTDLPSTITCGSSQNGSSSLPSLCEFEEDHESGLLSKLKRCKNLRVCLIPIDVGIEQKRLKFSSSKRKADFSNIFGSPFTSPATKKTLTEDPVNIPSTPASSSYSCHSNISKDLVLSSDSSFSCKYSSPSSSNEVSGPSIGQNNSSLPIVELKVTDETLARDFFDLSHKTADNLPHTTELTLSLPMSANNSNLHPASTHSSETSSALELTHDKVTNLNKSNAVDSSHKLLKTSPSKLNRSVSLPCSPNDNFSNSASVDKLQMRKRVLKSTGSMPKNLTSPSSELLRSTPEQLPSTSSALACRTSYTQSTSIGLDSCDKQLRVSLDRLETTENASLVKSCGIRPTIETPWLPEVSKTIPEELTSAPSIVFAFNKQLRVSLKRLETTKSTVNLQKWTFPDQEKGGFMCIGEDVVKVDDCRNVFTKLFIAPEDGILSKKMNSLGINRLPDLPIVHQIQSPSREHLIAGANHDAANKCLMNSRLTKMPNKVSKQVKEINLISENHLLLKLEKSTIDFLKPSVKEEQPNLCSRENSVEPSTSDGSSKRTSVKSLIDDLIYQDQNEVLDYEPEDDYSSISGNLDDFSDSEFTEDKKNDDYSSISGNSDHFSDCESNEDRNDAYQDEQTETEKYSEKHVSNDTSNEVISLKSHKAVFPEESTAKSTAKFSTLHVKGNQSKTRDLRHEAASETSVKASVHNNEEMVLQVHPNPFDRVDDDLEMEISNDQLKKPDSTSKVPDRKVPNFPNQKAATTMEVRKQPISCGPKEALSLFKIPKKPEKEKPKDKKVDPAAVAMENVNNEVLKGNLRVAINVLENCDVIREGKGLRQVILNVAKLANEKACYSVLGRLLSITAKHSNIPELDTLVTQIILYFDRGQNFRTLLVFLMECLKFLRKEKCAVSFKAISLIQDAFNPSDPDKRALFDLLYYIVVVCEFPTPKASLIESAIIGLKMIPNRIKEMFEILMKVDFSVLRQLGENNVRMVVNTLRSVNMSYLSDQLQQHVANVFRAVLRPPSMLTDVPLKTPSPVIPFTAPLTKPVLVSNQILTSSMPCTVSSINRTFPMANTLSNHQQSSVNATFLTSPNNVPVFNPSVPPPGMHIPSNNLMPQFPINLPFQPTGHQMMEPQSSNQVLKCPQNSRNLREIIVDLRNHGNFVDLVVIFNQSAVAQCNNNVLCTFCKEFCNAPMKDIFVVFTKFMVHATKMMFQDKELSKIQVFMLAELGIELFLHLYRHKDFHSAANILRTLNHSDINFYHVLVEAENDGLQFKVKSIVHCPLQTVVLQATNCYIKVNDPTQAYHLLLECNMLSHKTKIPIGLLPEWFFMMMELITDFVKNLAWPKAQLVFDEVAQRKMDSSCELEFGHALNKVYNSLMKSLLNHRLIVRCIALCKYFRDEMFHEKKLLLEPQYLRALVILSIDFGQYSEAKRLFKEFSLLGVYKMPRFPENSVTFNLRIPVNLAPQEIHLMLDLYLTDLVKSVQASEILEEKLRFRISFKDSKDDGLYVENSKSELDCLSIIEADTLLALSRTEAVLVNILDFRTTSGVKPTPWLETSERSLKRYITSHPSFVPSFSSVSSSSSSQAASIKKGTKGNVHDRLGFRQPAKRGGKRLKHIQTAPKRQLQFSETNNAPVEEYEPQPVPFGTNKIHFEDSDNSQESVDLKKDLNFSVTFSNKDNKFKHIVSPMKSPVSSPATPIFKGVNFNFNSNPSLKNRAVNINNCDLNQGETSTRVCSSDEFIRPVLPAARKPVQAPALLEHKVGTNRKIAIRKRNLQNKCDATVEDNSRSQVNQSLQFKTCSVDLNAAALNNVSTPMGRPNNRVLKRVQKLAADIKKKYMSPARMTPRHTSFDEHLDNVSDLNHNFLEPGSAISNKQQNRQEHGIPRRNRITFDSAGSASRNARISDVSEADRYKIEHFLLIELIKTKKFDSVQCETRKTALTNMFIRTVLNGSERLTSAARKNLVIFAKQHIG